MNQRPQNKLFYIGRSSAVLLLFALIGLWIHGLLPQHVQKEANATNPTPLSFSSSSSHGNNNTVSPSANGASLAGNKVDEADHTYIPDLGPEGEPMITEALHVNEIGNMALLGFFWWLSSCCDVSGDGLTFTISKQQYIVAGLIVTAMVSYLGYFFYQKYIVQQVSLASLAKDIGLFGALSALAIVGFYPSFFEWLECIVDGNDDNNNDNILKSVEKGIIFYRKQLLFKAYFVIFVAYHLAIKAIAHFKSNRNIKIEEGYGIMQLFSMLILTNIWNIMEGDGEWSPIIRKLLLTLSVWVVYVQAFWDPKLPSIDNENITAILVWFFHTSRVSEGLGMVCHIYYLAQDTSKVTKPWLVGECRLLVWTFFKWGFLYHFKIKKHTTTEQYTAHFPLSVAQLLEGTFMILVGVYAPLSICYPTAVASREEKILCVCLLLMGGLWIKLKLRESKSLLAEWSGYIGYELMSSTGSLVARYYLLSNTVGNDTKKRLIGAGSLLVLMIYIIPKVLNRIAIAHLALTKTPETCKKIALFIKGITAFWLELSMQDVLYLGFLALLTDATIKGKLANDKIALMRNIVSYFIGYLALVLVLHVLLAKGYLDFLGSWEDERTILYAWGILLTLYSEYTKDVPSNILRISPLRIRFFYGMLCLFWAPYTIYKISIALLDWQEMPSILRKVVVAIKGFTALWLQPNLDVVCTALVAGGGVIYACQNSKNGAKFGIIIYAVALAVYGIVEVLAYNLPAQRQLADAFMHMVSFLAFVSTIVLSSGRGDPALKSGVRLLCYVLFYMGVGLLVQMAQHLLDIKGYRKKPLLSFYRIDKRLYAGCTYVLQWCIGGLVLLKSYAFLEQVYRQQQLREGKTPDR